MVLSRPCGAKPEFAQVTGFWLSWVLAFKLPFEIVFSATTTAMGMAVAVPMAMAMAMGHGWFYVVLACFGWFWPVWAGESQF